MLTSSRRPHVVHVGKYYPPAPGGMERVVQSLCEVEGAVVDSRALVFNTERRTIHETYRGVPVTRVARYRSVGSVAVCPTFPLWLSRVRADIVVLHEPNPVALVSDLVGRPRGRLVVWFHSEVVRPAWRYRLFYRPFFRAAVTRAVRIVTASPALAENAQQLAGVRHKCTVIPYGLDVPRFALTATVAQRVAEIRRAHGDRLVLFVGRRVPYKGIDVLLAALRGLEARAVLVGDGPLRPSLQAAASDTDLAGRVVFAGEVPDAELLALYHASDLLALPSVTRAEAFGVVQLEAMACGRPVVSTNLPTGVPWVNRHGETGLVVPPGDPAALRDALARVLDNRGFARELGERGRQRVEAEFTVERMVDRTTALYQEILQGAADACVAPL
jgi:glycosyltransferase involved in cell wall biosynthesis